MAEVQVEGVRLQKWLADAGLCSRREGEKWIAAGRVAVNGVVVTEQGVKVVRGDQVALDGKEVGVQKQRKVYLMLHKPKGVLCTRSDPEGRPTIYQMLDPRLPRVVSVGRLDFNSEGLLLLTNDGDLAQRLQHPSHGAARIYRARVRGKGAEKCLPALQAGVTLEDGPTGPLEATLDWTRGEQAWYTLTLREGRNRMVRRIFETLGLQVARLIRVGHGGLTLGELPTGGLRFLTREEISILRAEGDACDVAGS
ncbi:MAG: rRNA pseudouridine synthase [Magnetococcales bacterium]|nr:rRNA pseudouridine synthase [Magnetococcales bacterium]